MRVVTIWELWTNPHDDPSHPFHELMNDHDYIVVESNEGLFIHQKVSDDSVVDSNDIGTRQECDTRPYNMSMRIGAMKAETSAYTGNEYKIISYHYDSTILTSIKYGTGSVRNNPRVVSHSRLLDMLITYCDNNIKSIKLMTKDEFNVWLSNDKTLNEQWIVDKLDTNKG